MIGSFHRTQTFRTPGGLELDRLTSRERDVMIHSKHGSSGASHAKPQSVVAEVLASEGCRGSWLMGLRRGLAYGESHAGVTNVGSR
jgi:hypothetical protein